MADRAIELLNKLLKIFNTEAGIYLDLVGNSNNVTPPLSGDVKINDIDTGAISNVLEYLRRISLFLLDQIDVSKAVAEFLDFILVNFYGIARISTETDADYFSRAKLLLFAIKVTRPSIMNALSPYGTNIQLIEGGSGGAFSEVSFANLYRDFNLPAQDVVRNATTFPIGPLIYYFKIIMETVSPSDFITIARIINAYKAAGIAYDVEIN